ncbi:MAG TPA: MmgE/PrpD family protein [Actinocrinis sp.]
MSRPARSVTGDIAAFVSETPSAAIPAEARQAGIRSVLDTVGVLLAGLGEPVVRIVAAELVGGPGPATLLGQGRTASAADAALFNGTAAHALDYDDVHSHLRGHPSACVLPAAFAAAEHAGLTGAGLLDAYVIGVEVECGIGRAFGPSHAARGFHSTSTLGVLGAAAAAARALGLDAGETAAALGIAASSASGLRRNFGTATKPLHAGNAARAGVVAALLAGAGVAAAPDIVESFVDAFNSDDDGAPDAIGRLGAPWAIVDPGMSIKKYPCCNRGHRAVDAVLDIVRALDAAAGEVAAVEVRMPAGQVDPDGRVGPMTYPVPRTGAEAKFSMPYVVAAAIVDRGLPINAFTDDGIHRPAVQDLLAKVHPVNRDDTDDHVEVVMTLHDGRACGRRVHRSRGDPRGGEPPGLDELTAKYTDCASVVLPPEAVAQSMSLVLRLDSLPTVSELAAALSGKADG